MLLKRVPSFRFGVQNLRILCFQQPLNQNCVPVRAVGSWVFICLFLQPLCSVTPVWGIVFSQCYQFCHSSHACYHPCLAVSIMVLSSQFVFHKCWLSAPSFSNEAAVSKLTHRMSQNIPIFLLWCLDKWTNLRYCRHPLSLLSGCFILVLRTVLFFRPEILLEEGYNTKRFH